MVNKSLLEKIKDGIRKSGFPLELKIGSVLEKNDWSYSIGNIYKDFETLKLREIDVVAQKTINGISVHLFIECKKSEDKQLILYSPKNSRSHRLLTLWTKIFPRIKITENTNYSRKDILNEFRSLKHFDKTVPLSKSLIVSKANIVTADNISYLSSINGLVKESIHTGSDGYLETNFRCIFFYILVFDGILLQLSNSSTEDFDLKEIDYGQLEFKYEFQFDKEYLENDSDDLVTTAKQFGTKYIIEFIKPEIFENHIIDIESKLSKIDLKKFKKWGKSWGGPI